MAWEEVVERRLRGSRVWREGNAYRVSSTLGEIHYESTLDSGVYDTEVDFRPRRVTAGGADLWLVQDAGFTYAIGRRPGLQSDGWVGFGARTPQGLRSLWYRLARVGYMYWPDRAFDQLGGPPTYDRAKLTHANQTLTIGPNGDVVPISTLATWSDLWPTLPAGEISLQLNVDGRGIKEVVRFSQQARQWVKVNRPPGTPADETFFGFVYQLDLTAIPRVLKAAIEQDLEGDFEDDGSSPFELRDAATNRLLALLPVGEARVLYAKDYDLGEQGIRTEYEYKTLKLRKRLWRDEDGNHYLIVGAKVGDLNALPDGDILFDPSVSPTVPGGAWDAYEQGDTGYQDSLSYILMYSNSDTSADVYRCAAVGWVLDVPQGATITAATAEFYVLDRDDPYGTFYGNDVDDATDLSTLASIIDSGDRPRTTASLAVNEENLGNNAWWETADFSAIVEEVVGRPGWVANNHFLLLMIAQNAFLQWFKAEAYDDTGSSNHAVLNVTYTATQTLVGDAVIASGESLPAGVLVVETQTLVGDAAIASGESLSDGVLSVETQTLVGDAVIASGESLSDGVIGAVTQTLVGDAAIASGESLPTGVLAAVAQTLVGDAVIASGESLSDGVLVAAAQTLVGDAPIASSEALAVGRVRILTEGTAYQHVVGAEARVSQPGGARVHVLAEQVRGEAV